MRSARCQTSTKARTRISLESLEKKPRVIRLEACYALSPLEIELFTLLVLKVSAKSLACRSWLAEYGVDGV